MKITILYDNTAFKNDLTPDWGFSALVEAHGRTLLFDTGAEGSVLLGNMQKLGVQPESIEEVFISHNHFDHLGGLSEFLSKNRKVDIYVPPTVRGIHNAHKITRLEKPTRLHDHFFSTGELDHIEQSLAVETDKGLVLVVGCSHPPMDQILSAASRFGTLYGIVGGLHGFREFELFENLQLICPTHCTQHIGEIKSRYPDHYLEGGAGKVIEI
mgnify:CR=1 FL=1